MTELLYKEEVFAIAGAAMEVHNMLGNGFLAAVYQEAMEIEFNHRRIPFETQRELNISYKGGFYRKRTKPILSCTGKSSLKSRPSVV